MNTQALALELDLSAKRGAGPRLSWSIGVAENLGREAKP
jgi:hypothetical protein